MRRRPPGLGEYADATHKSVWPQRHVPPSCRAISGGISETLVDNLLSVGIEGKWTKPDEEVYEAILGPSIQWRPTDNTHLDLVAMAGLTHSAPNAECWLIFGFDFGKGSHEANERGGSLIRLNRRLRFKGTPQEGCDLNLCFLNLCSSVKSVVKI